MRKFLYAFAFVVCTTISMGQAFATPLLSLDLVGPQKIHAGQTTAFQLNISGLTNLLGAFDVGITFDTTVLSFEGIQFGPFLGDPDPLSFESVPFVDTSVSGVVDFGEVSLLEDVANCVFCIGPYLDDLQKDASGNFRDSLTLAAIVFKGIGSGQSNIDFNGVIDLADSLGNSMTDVDVGPGDTVKVPEPTSLFLIGMGLIAMFGLRRMRLRVRNNS